MKRAISWVVGATLSLVTGLATGLVTGAAQAQDTKQMCVDAYVANQKLRKEGALVEAREQLEICVRADCPDTIKKDCSSWLSQVDQELPSITVAVTVDGRDVADVVVFLDGREIANGLDGRPINVDPGPHKLRLEHAGQTEELDVVIQQGVKSRPISVSFGGDSPVPDPAPTPAPDNDEGGGYGMLVAGVAIGVVGLAGIGMFIGLGVSGQNDADELQQTCGMAGNCTQEQVDAVESKLVGADIALGIGAGLTAVGVALVIVHFVTADEDEEPPSEAVTFDLGPTVGGAYGGVTVVF